MSTTLTRTGLRVGLNNTTDNSSAAEFNFEHAWINYQGIGALLAIGAGVKSGFEVTEDTGLTVAISPGLAVAESTTYGGVALQRTTAGSLLLDASSTLYVFATVQVDVSNDSRQTGLPSFVADDSDSLDGGVLLAKVVTGVGTITSVLDMRQMLDSLPAVDLFAYDESNSSGLDFGYGAGRIRQADGTIVTVAASTVTLANNDVSYIEIDDAGAVSDNVIGWSSDQKALWEVTTAGGFITVVEDRRVGFDFGGSGTGSSDWASITGTPTTLAGYGITDAASDTELGTETTNRTAADTTLQANIDTVSGDLATHITADAANIKSDGSVAMAADLDMGGNEAVNAATPTTSGSLVTKGYADSLIGASAAPWLSVRAATTANISLTGEQTIDTVALVSGDRVLVKNQSTGSQNGIYVVSAGAWSRATDADADAEFDAGKTVFIEYGTDNEQERWALLTSSVVVGTTAQVWTQTEAGGGGESNTASNVNSEGVGIFKQKAGIDLQFNGVVSTNSFLTVALNVATNAIRFTVNEAALTLNNLLGTLSGTKGGTGHSTTAVGDTLVGAASDTWAKPTKNTSTTRKFFRQIGDGAGNVVSTIWDTLLGADLPTFIASGGSHAPGAVPDPGATAGTTRYLCEDATFKVPPGSGGWDATSTTSVTIPASITGSKSWFIGTGYAFTVGQHIRGAQTSAPATNYIGGTVTSYSAGTITALVDEFAGSGVYSDWTVSATGAPGATGAAGTNGTNGTNGQGVPTGGTTGQVLAKINGTDYNTQWVAPATGTGDVVGPGSAVNNNFVAFDTTTGKLVKDSGSAAASFAAATHNHAASDINSGTLALARGGTNADLSAAGGAVNTTGKQVLHMDASHVISSSAIAAVDLPTDIRTRTLTFIIDGGGATITTGVKGDLVADVACTIQSVTLLADQSGSIVVDIWKDTYANFPPVVGDKITASAPPTITTATKSQDTTLTGWTTSITAGDILRFNVNSITTCQRVTVALKVLV